MKRHAKLDLLAGAAVLAAGAASAQIVDDYGVTQPAAGVSGVGINDAAPPQVVREGGYIPPAELQQRAAEGTLDSNVVVRPPAAQVDANARAGLPAPAAPVSVAAAGAAGLTAAQLDDADLVTNTGMEIGEVEAVLVDASGRPASVLVELDDDMFVDERLVEIPLAELRTQPANKYLNIWSDRVDLVSDRPMSWFEQADDWRVSPRFGASSASASAR